MKGYFAIGIYHPKTPSNIGTLWRSAFNFGAAYIFTIGHRYKHQSSDTVKTPRHIPLFQYDTFESFQAARPYDCLLVGIEQSRTSVPLESIKHPERAIYLLGAEDGGLPETIQAKCQKVVHISSPMCLNVSVAGSIVMYARTLTGMPTLKSNQEG